MGVYSLIPSARGKGPPWPSSLWHPEGAAAKLTWVQLPGVEQEYEVQTTEAPWLSSKPHCIPQNNFI